MNELTENKQNLPVSSDSETMPVPAPGKTLYITQDTKGFDYRSILGQVVQYVNMGDVLLKLKQVHSMSFRFLLNFRKHSSLVNIL